MTTPIRDMASLAAAARTAQIERGLSDLVLEHIAGLATGSVAKYLAPNPSKNLGPVSTFPLLGALGKCLVLVDDPEMIPKVEGRWKRRIVKGGATLQMRARDPLLASALSIDENRREYMRKLGSKGGKMGGSKGGKRRLKTMSKRARQRVATHAARARWSRPKQPS